MRECTQVSVFGAFMYVCMMYIHGWVCVYMHVCIMYAWLYARVRVCVVLVIMCVWLRVAVFWTRLVRSGPVAGDPDPIRIRAVVDPIHRQFEDRSMG